MCDKIDVKRSFAVEITNNANEILISNAAELTLTDNMKQSSRRMKTPCLLSKIREVRSPFERIIYEGFRTKLTVITQQSSCLSA